MSNNETRTELIVGITVVLCFIIVAALFGFTIKACNDNEYKMDIKTKQLKRNEQIEGLRQKRTTDSLNWEKEKIYLEKGYVREQIPDENKFYWVKE
ncbi:unnamed protein product [marine sediment metagenome]|uniref:Septum formation initiator n=1 Tax=marine sediment metagenome TaxID=412755 RepID=X0YPV5_9ZZZZ